MKHLASTIWHYYRTRVLDRHFNSRATLEQHQRRELARHLAFVARHSPYFAPYAGQSLSEWPIMDKASMLANFDRMNTADLRLADVFDVALRSERERDFAPLLQGYTVGLSSGTSGQRGVFVASAAERARWAGVMLGKALPRGLFDGERVALFLRANSSLYTAVQSRWLTFRFFDLFAEFAGHLAPLQHYAPTVLVAPAQVLHALAQAKLEGRLDIAPVKVISAAEVLEPAERAYIESAFGSVHELYQATEGFIASTCEYGSLHLNEEFLHVEPEWLDEAQTRFVPIITDFSRTTQPIVRYRLNDVLVRRPQPCPCGRHSMAVSAIEGRCDDRLVLPGADGKPVTVFADHVSRVLACNLPLAADYRLVQLDKTQLCLQAHLDHASLCAAGAALRQALGAVGVDQALLRLTYESTLPAVDLTVKRRRIVNRYRQEGA